MRSRHQARRVFNLARRCTGCHTACRRCQRAGTALLAACAPRQGGGGGCGGSVATVRRTTQAGARRTAACYAARGACECGSRVCRVASGYPARGGGTGVWAHGTGSERPPPGAPRALPLALSCRRLAPRAARGAAPHNCTVVGVAARSTPRSQCRYGGRAGGAGTTGVVASPPRRACCRLGRVARSNASSGAGSRLPAGCRHCATAGWRARRVCNMVCRGLAAYLASSTNPQCCCTGRNCRQAAGSSRFRTLAAGCMAELESSGGAPSHPARCGACAVSWWPASGTVLLARPRPRPDSCRGEPPPLPGCRGARVAPGVRWRAGAGGAHARPATRG